MLFTITYNVFVTGDNRYNQLGIAEKKIITELTKLDFTFD